MSSIQGISASTAAANAAPKSPPPAAQTRTPEATEKPQQERGEALRGAAETGESRNPNPSVGSLFTATA
jgi:hypothetical protein